MFPGYTTICLFWICFQKSAAVSIPDVNPQSNEVLKDISLSTSSPDVNPVPNEVLQDISLKTSNPFALNLQPVDDTTISIESSTALDEEENSSVSRVNLNLDPISGADNDTSECKDVCVWYYQCNGGKINTNGAGIINIRDKNLPCGDIFHVCCKLENISSTNITPDPPPTPRPQGCGYRRANGIGIRITGEEENESQFGEFPWMVAIFADSKPLPKCGGALVHPQAVITAAHCVSSRVNNLLVRVGEWNLNIASEAFLHQEVSVQSVTIHNQFYSGALFNDIAFLYLEKPVELAPNVEVICLPPQDHVHKLVSGKCFSTGWGKNREGRDGQYQSIMKKIDLPLVSRDICQAQLRKTRLGNFFNLHRTFLCAGGEAGKDACTGDGGSPLVCPMEGQVERYYQAGIVSWGIGCGSADVPGVYVDVAQFRDWIDEQITNHSLDPEGYRANSTFD